MSVAADTAVGGRLGVLGGTFDPIHVGHLLLAEQAREELGLQRVLFIPSAHPPHKLQRHVTSGEDRYQMALLATGTNPHFAVSRRELERDGPSYTIVTIRELRAEGHEALYFIVGADAALEMRTWRQPEDILRECQVVAAARPGFDLDALPAALGAEWAQRVRILGARQVDISSTDIRQRVAQGRSIRYMVPEAVESYIREKGLYKAT